MPIYQPAKSGWINESDLIDQLAGLMDKVDLDETGMKNHLKADIEKHKKFQSTLLGEKPVSIKATDIDIRNYAKYILHESGIQEKRELLGCLKSKIVVNNKMVRIVEQTPNMN